MKCKIERIEEKLRNGETIYGTHSAMGGAVTTEIYGTVGFDALWIDMEHGCIDKKDLLTAIIGAAGSDMVTFVRVPWNDMVQVKPILEMGCDGIIFPMITTAEEARYAVASCAYPPEGVRGFGPCRCIQYGKIDAQDYIHNYSKKIWKIVQIEHIKAVENLDEILKVDGINMFIIGPCDLSGSIGLLAQTKHPDVKAVMDGIAAKLKAAGKPFGVSMGYDEEAIRDWVRRGASFLFADNDINYLYNGSANTLNNLKRLSNSRSQGECPKNIKEKGELL